MINPVALLILTNSKCAPKQVSHAIRFCINYLSIMNIFTDNDIQNNMGYYQIHFS